MAPRDNFSSDVARAIAAGTSESLRPHATLDDVIGVALSHPGRVPRAEVEEGLAWAGQASDWKELRPLYQPRYRGHWMSNAVEILSSAMAIFSLCGGNVEPAIVNSVNMGRDTDCRAYIAGGWSAGLRGIEDLPARWLDTVTEQGIADKYTVSKRTPLESARGLYEAVIASVQDSRQRIQDLGPHGPSTSFGTAEKESVAI